MVTPFLKWAGGKRWLVARNALPVPNHFERYVEPFLGSGAVFFAINPHRALLSDLNQDLICLYKVTRDYPNELISILRKHQKYHCKEYYYYMRSQIFLDEIENAARFLYLNRTCWNGLYRVNLKGQFNVPIGSKKNVLFDTDDFCSISERLKGHDIRCSDFEEVIDECGEGDFIFADPPYTVQHNFNNFLKYNEKIFSWEDQVRLRNCLERASMRGAKVAITNADHEEIRKLYKNLGSYIQLQRHSVLAASTIKRGITTEALFLANIT